MKLHFFLARLALTLAAILGSAVSLPAVESPPPPGPPRPVRFPIPVEQRLGSGLRVLVVPRHHVPLVAAQLIIRTGGEGDPPAKPGVAQLTADLLTQGTRSRSATQIAAAVDTLGAQLDASAGWDASRVSVSATTPRFAAALAILADVAQHPTFQPSEIDRRKTLALSDLQVELNNPTALARMAMSRVLYGAAAYGHPLPGTPASLRAMTRADLIRFHQTYYRPDNAILLLGGDIEPAAAFALARREFGAWRAARPVPAPAPRRPAASPPRVVVVDKPDAGRAAILVGRVAIARADAAYYAGLVTNSVLSGYSGRLNEEIRVKRGLSYGAGSSLDPRRRPGPFTASTLVDNSKAVPGTSLMLDTITGLDKESVAPAELQPRKAAVTGAFARSAETIGGLLGQVGSLALYDIPQSELNRYIGRVDAVTEAQVQAFARRWLASGESVVIVGNSKLFLADLRRQFPQVEVIPFARLDLDRPEMRRRP